MDMQQAFGASIFSVSGESSITDSSLKTRPWFLESFLIGVEGNASWELLATISVRDAS